MSDHIQSLKHKGEKRAHIPSHEEAGMEAAVDNVARKLTAEYMKNPIVHRGQDPELWWMNKYGNDDREELLKVDIRSLYRHEHISPELLIRQLYKVKESKNNEAQLNLYELFGNTLQMDEMDKVADYYQYSDEWKNRLIQGDSLLVMGSLLEREGMAGKVQTIYFDPPYGIKYNSNWQMKLNSRDVKDGSDDHLTGEPEQIKAFRDTWEFGIHSYLGYLRDRLLIAKELLTESGSCFVQISDENVHLVRNVMDEVFGSDNFCSIIAFRKTSSAGSISGGTDILASTCDYIIWYCKNKELVKYRQLYTEKKSAEGEGMYTLVELPDGQRRRLSSEERNNISLLPKGSRIFRADNLTSQTGVDKTRYDVHFENKIYKPSKGVWKTSFNGMQSLIEKRRVINTGNNLSYVRFFNDFPYQSINNLWEDTGLTDKLYIVQTTKKVIERCLLMTSDPGDLVLDPTTGSGTTAFVAEQWGRRWISIDTSRIAVNIAKTRLTTATFPYYKLHDEQNEDIRQGFQYKKVPHITLKSLANNEPADEETLYDQPFEDKKKLRVAGPFTVETLQNFETISPDELDKTPAEDEELGRFEERIFEHLRSAGVKNGIRNENAVFKRIERTASEILHAEGFYNDSEGKERKAYIYIGPKFGTVSRQAVNEAIKECRQAGDADWLIILGFSFDSDISNQNVTASLGSFIVTKVRMHDDLMQEGLLKKDKKAASFVTIGEPDVQLINYTGESPTQSIFKQVEICGLDIYDPITDEVKARSTKDIAYWMVDDDYDGSNFIVKQLFFCGGDEDEFDKWRKSLDSLSKQNTKAKAEKTLKIELDDEAWDRLYDFRSHPIEYRKGRRIAIRVISQFGEESTKVLTM